MEYADQSAHDLRFYLVSGVVDVASLTVLTTAGFKWKQRDIRIGILGASHFLSVTEPDGSSLYEVFACAEIKIEYPLIKSGPLGRLQSTVESHVGGLLYTFKPRLVTSGAGAVELQELTALVRGALSGRDCYGLVFLFPQSARETLPPVTLVLAEVGEGLRLRTAHCYPNEQIIVFTETTIIERSEP